MARFQSSRGQLSGKVALVTGATSGIGRAVAIAFADAGTSVAVGDIREQPVGGGKSTREIIERQGGNALFVQADVADKKQVQALVEHTVKEYGRVDFLVNNAGFGHIGLVEHVPEEVLLQLVQVNFLGVIYGVQGILPIMRAQRSGHIINVASGAALFGLPYASIYSATKAAIMRFSEAVRYELEEANIHVSTIFPDFTSTDLALVAARGGGEPIRTVRFLNSEGVKWFGLPRAKLRSAEEVARSVIECALKPRPEVYLSHRIRFHGLIRFLFQGAVEREARMRRDATRELLEKVWKEENIEQKTLPSDNYSSSNL
jgi:NAD(P)-dependent dehydrogenase (short-subunit alcohol dehydrogenase family)